MSVTFTSSSRSITLRSGLSAVPYLSVPAINWEPAQPGENLDYVLFLASYPVGGGQCLGQIIGAGEAIAIVSLSVEPSGAGELAALDLSVNGSTITAQFGAGVAGRSYVTRLIVTMISGRGIVIPVGLYLGSVLATWPPVQPPSWDFGTPITWSSGATVFGPAIAAVANGLIGTGTNQATALVVPAQTNIIASAPPGTGFILPNIVSGTIVVQNNDLTNSATIYPPIGAALVVAGVTLAVNAPFYLGSEAASADFSTQRGSTLWVQR